jgi:hypothetical protein
MDFFPSGCGFLGSGSGKRATSHRRHRWPLGGAFVSCTSACIFFGATATEITLLSAVEDLEIIPATSALGAKSRQTPSIAWHPSAIREKG